MEVFGVILSMYLNLPEPEPAKVLLRMGQIADFENSYGSPSHSEPNVLGVME
jgi:hypothetical protein